MQERGGERGELVLVEGFIEVCKRKGLKVNADKSKDAVVLGG